MLFKWDYIDERFDKKDFAVCLTAISSFCVVLTVCCTARMYTHESFHVSEAKENVRMSAQSDGIHIKMNHQEYVVDPDNVVEYNASDENSEVVELSCVRKAYRPMVPGFIYYLYYMDTPNIETTVEVVSCSVSEYKSK